MENFEKISESSVSPYTNFSKWLKKRIRANRFHFMSNLDLDHWPAGKFLEYKGFIYIPLKIDWPENRDYGILYLKPVGRTRKLQSGPSTTLIPLNPYQIRVQVSREIKKRKTSIKNTIKKTPYEKMIKKMLIKP
jgi:hypothetical protein